MAFMANVLHNAISFGLKLNVEATIEHVSKVFLLYSDYQLNHRGPHSIMKQKWGFNSILYHPNRKTYILIFEFFRNFARNYAGSVDVI